MAHAIFTEDQLIALCKAEDTAAQRAFYERFAPRMLGVCRRYVNDKDDAEDILAEAMYKALSNFHQFEGNGSLEGWLRRIVVNQALMFLRKHKHLINQESLEEFHHPAVDASIEVELSAADILLLLAELPTGYRTVFNLYVIEGLKHQEIADLLSISVSTSKTQLLLAKQKLQGLIRSRFGSDYYPNS